jgi:signal peptidase I
MRGGLWRPVVAVLALVIVWDLIAPTQLGGRISYVNVRGISMQPTLYTGDLMVLRRLDAYEVGQIVAFESDMNGAIVVHRIVDIVGEKHLLKGDNNSFLDRYTPTVDEIIGAEVLTVPGGERFANLAAATPTIVVQALMLLVTLWVLRVSRREAQRQRKAARRRRAVALAVPIRDVEGDSPVATVVELER